WTLALAGFEYRVGSCVFGTEGAGLFIAKKRRMAHCAGLDLDRGFRTSAFSLSRNQPVFCCLCVAYAGTISVGSARLDWLDCLGGAGSRQEPCESRHGGFCSHFDLLLLLRSARQAGPFG